MQPEIERIVKAAIGHQLTTADEMAAAMGCVMDGRAEGMEIASLLTALAVRGETADEIAGAARAMHQRSTRIPHASKNLLDTCGTGGDQLHTFNISTAAAIVASAAGARVAKHGNRQASSRSGSADVLEALGVNITLPPEGVANCIDSIGIGFCFARLLHQAMKYVAPVRQQLGIRTIFNLLGPLTNPAGAEFQIIGANRNETALKLAQAKQQLGGTRTLVVCGNDQLDEVALWGTTLIYDITPSGICTHQWTAGDLGLPECTPDQLKVNSPQESASVILAIFAGQPGPARDITVANAGAALLTAGLSSNLRDAVERAGQAIESGAAREKLAQLIRGSGVSSHASPNP